MNRPFALIIDDTRNASECYLHGEKQKLVDFSGIPEGSWNIVRNYNQFIRYIKTKGVPHHISFDNDLCQDHMLLYVEAAKSGNFEWFETQPRMGIHALEWLLNYCKKNNVDRPTIYINTANFFARAKMEEMLGRESLPDEKSAGGIIIS